MSSQVVGGGGSGGGDGAGSSSGGGRRSKGVKRSKDWWIACSRPDYPRNEFLKQFHMSRETFDLICEELKPRLTRQFTGVGEPVPVEERVAICIRRLATGESLPTLSNKFGVSSSSVDNIVKEVSKEIEDVLRPKFIKWPDQQTLDMIKTGFQTISGIPNVVGSLYTTHVPLSAQDPDYFNPRLTDRNRGRRSYSMAIQGVVDHKGIFIDCDTGGRGSMNDDQIFEHSSMYQRINGGLLRGDWIVGNSVFPLMNGLLVPYTHQDRTWTQRLFVQQITRIREVAYEAFVRLKGRWACLKKLTDLKVENLPVIIGACCVLHNICEIQGDEMLKAEWRLDVIDDETVPEISVRSESARQARDEIAGDLVDALYNLSLGS